MGIECGSPVSLLTERLARGAGVNDQLRGPDTTVRTRLWIVDPFGDRVPAGLQWLPKAVKARHYPKGEVRMR